MTGLLTVRVSPVNRATAQPRNSAGISFAQIRFLPPLPHNPRRLPQTACRCPGFDNDCPEFWWGERPREPHCPDFWNTADLEWPATDPANAGVRDEFLLGIFPPDHGGNHAPPAPPQPTPPAK
jgi:hypothetical protein